MKIHWNYESSNPRLNDEGLMYVGVFEAISVFQRRAVFTFDIDFRVCHWPCATSSYTTYTYICIHIHTCITGRKKKTEIFSSIFPWEYIFFTLYLRESNFPRRSATSFYLGIFPRENFCCDMLIYRKTLIRHKRQENVRFSGRDGMEVATFRCLARFACGIFSRWRNRDVRGLLIARKLTRVIWFSFFRPPRSLAMASRAREISRTTRRRFHAALFPMWPTVVAIMAVLEAFRFEYPPPLAKSLVEAVWWISMETRRRARPFYVASFVSFFLFFSILKKTFDTNLRNVLRNNVRLTTSEKQMIVHLSKRKLIFSI